MSIEENKQIVRRYHTELWAGNMAVADQLLAPDSTSGMGTPEQIKAAVSSSLAVIPDLKFQIEEMIAEGDKVVMRWQMRGTNTGPDTAADGRLMPPTGQPFTFTGITINQVQDGKIIADVFENGWMNMLLQTGRITLT